MREPSSGWAAADVQKVNIMGAARGDGEWDVVWSEARAERKVAERLAAKGYAVFVAAHGLLTALL